jgi:5-methylcytosine-specific restriction endonuclease McrA
MSDHFSSSMALLEHLKGLRQSRERGKDAGKQVPRARLSLSKSERSVVLGKTSGRCHICGGTIEGEWQADHVLAHSAGGVHDVDNYLPAHSVCNNYRWDYLAEEFQLILKLGVWARTQIERQTGIGQSLAEAFTLKERARLKRRKTGAI